MPKALEQPIPKEEDKKEEAQSIETDIERVHEKALHDIELEDNGGNHEEEPAGDEGEEEPKKDEEEAKPAEEPAPKAPEQIDEERKEPEPDKEPEPEDEVIPPVRVQDSEGEWHEFDSIDDVPDDFEPSTYKSWGKAVQEFANRSAKEEDRQRKANEAAEAKEKAQRLKEINEAWDKEVDDLIKSEAIKYDDREDTVTSVFALMKEEMDKGRRIDSFTQAWEIYNYREGLKAKDETKKQDNKAKKERGARVLATGTPAPAKPSRGKMIEAPPTGTTLDQVHEHILGSL